MYSLIAQSVEHAAVNRGVAGSSPAGRATILLLVGNKSKDVKIILLITKAEAFAMRKIVGENMVKKSYSGNPHYYLVEDHAAMSALKEYRKSHIVATAK